MNKIFKKLTKRTLINNFNQFISVIFIVILASMLLSGFITNYLMLNKTISNYFDGTKLADAWFYVDKVSSEDENFFSSINDINFDKRYYLETKVEISDSNVANNGKVYVYDGKISNPYKESGMWGCVIDKKVAQDNNLKVGLDEIKITLDYKINDEKYELNCYFLITGTMSLDECADTNSSWPVFITSEWFLDEFNNSLVAASQNNDLKLDSVPYSQILIKLKGDKKDENRIDEIISNVNQYYSETSQNKLLYSLKQDSVESVVILTDEIKQTKKMIYIFPVIFLIVSVLIILTSIDQLVAQERQKIGIMKSIGIPNKTIIKFYSKFGAYLCAIGSLIGSIMGAIFIPPIMFLKYNLVYSIPVDYIASIFPIKWLAIVILGITLLGFIVSVIACNNILRKNPIECLKFQVTNSKSFSKNNKITKLVKKSPFSLKMALRNLKLKPIRSIMAIIGIAGCLALLLCGFGIGDTLRSSVNYDYGKVFSYDITTTYSRDDFEENLKSLDGLKSYEKFEKMYVLAKSQNYSRNINLYKISSQSNFSSIKLNSGDVFISESFAKDYGVSVGDNLSVTLGNVTKNLTITVINKTSILNGIYVCDELGFDDVYKINGMWINCENFNENSINYINSINGTNTACSIDKNISSLKTKISSISIMTTTLKIFAVILAVIVLMNLIFLISKERVREIATLKVIGRSNYSILLSLFFEIMFICLVGMIFGMILGYPLLVAVLSINKVNILHYIYKISFLSFFASFIIAIITILSMMLFCAIKIKNINMIESLKSME